MEIFDILGPHSHSLVPIEVKFCTAKRTEVPVGHAKFDLNRYNESPLRGKKTWFLKFNTGNLPLHSILPVKSCFLDVTGLTHFIKLVRFLYLILVVLIPRDAAKRQTTGIIFTHRAKIKFFATQAIRVELGRADGHMRPLRCEKFHVNRHRGGNAAPKISKISSFS